MEIIFKPKLFSLLKSGIRKEQLYRDVLAGIVVGIVALPLAIAFAVASGVSPDKGLITAIIAGLIISVFGGSRVQIGGPTGAFIVIVFGIVSQYGIDGLIISTIMAGILLVLFGVLRFGNLLKFIPHPLVVGFTSGIALVIFSTQIKDALALPIEQVPADFIGKWNVYFNNIDHLSFSALIITVITICISVFSKKITSRVPGSFIAIILVTAAVSIFKIQIPTIETFFGEIPRNFHFQIPRFESGFLVKYIQPAIVIALLGGIESLLSATVSDGMIGGNHRSNTELIAQGIANIITPFFGGIPATGAIARTATNVKNGGRTPIAGIVHALTLLSIMLFFGQYAKLIPMSCLAGILIVVSFNMSEIKSFKAILRGHIYDKIILLTTFLLTVFVDLTVAIEVGIVLSSLLFMKRMSDIAEKRIDDIVDSDLIDDYSNLPAQLGIYEISGPLFFASARRYSELIREVGIKREVLIIRLRHVSFIDQTGLESLLSTLKILKSQDISIILSGVNEEVLEKLHSNDIGKIVPDENFCDSFQQSLSRSKAILK